MFGCSMFGNQFSDGFLIYLILKVGSVTQRIQAIEGAL